MLRVTHAVRMRLRPIAAAARPLSSARHALSASAAVAKRAGNVLGIPHPAALSTGALVHASLARSMRVPVLVTDTRGAAALVLTDRRERDPDPVQRRSTRQFATALGGPSARRVLVSGRLQAGIEKRRTMRRRAFSSATPPKADASSVPASASASKNGVSDALGWRDALKSPRKAVRYAGQLRRDLVDWAKHIWSGAKLLAADVRVSWRILRRITNGKQISRRERGFIVQTGVDLARLVPFSLFLIIPLAEVALPVALKLFPNMLPSQFQDQMKREEDLKRKLKGRLELAKYLRDVVEEKAKAVKASDANSELKRDAEDLTEFLGAIRSGKEVGATDVARFARFFNDELTIDGSGRPQLVAMCKYMGISPYGHDQFLRFKLRSRLNAIKNDDMQIMWEGGADSLTDDEVAKACRDRGIRVTGSKKRIRRQLKDWLDLSQSKEIPGSLMIMSRAFLYTGADGLKDTLGSLPDDVLMDVKQAADGGEGSNEGRLEEARRQAKLIEIESETERRKEKDDEEKRKKKEGEEAAKHERAAATATAAEDASVEDASISDKQVMAEADAQDAELAKQISEPSEPTVAGPGEEAQPETDVSVIVEEKDEEELEKERDVIRNILLSLGELSSGSAVEMERKELASLKSELAEAEATVKESGEKDGIDLKRFKSLVSKLEKEIERVDAKVGLRMKLLDKDNDGLMSMEEVKNVMGVIAGNADDAVVASTLRRLDADADGNISKGDLARMLKEMQSEFSGVEALISAGTEKGTSS